MGAIEGTRMPTVRRDGPYRFYYYSNESDEPPHIHVDRDDSTAKFWLDPISLARSEGFSARELRRIERLIRDYQQDFLRAWNEHFGTSH
jgi:hypothetical protein